MHINKHGIALLTLAGFLSFTSCKKTSSTNADPGKFKDIKAAEGFNWSTTQKVNLQVEGLPFAVKEKNMLTVSSTDGKSVYLKQFVAMSENITTSFLAPRGASSLLVSFGTIQKTVAITGGNASFNYTTTED